MSNDKMREALEAAKHMLERDRIDPQKLAVIEQCEEALAAQASAEPVAVIDAKAIELLRAGNNCVPTLLSLCKMKDSDVEVYTHPPRAAGQVVPESKTINVSRIEKWLREESDRFHDAVGPNSRVDLLNQGRDEVIRTLLKRLRKFGLATSAPSEPKRVELTDYELMLSFGAVPLQRMVTDDLLLAIGRAAIAAHDKANGRGGAE